MKKKLLNFLGVMFIAQISFSQTITERFNYTDGTNLKDQSGWSLTTGTANAVTINNLTFASISDQDSKSFRLNGSSSSEVTSLDILSLNGGSVIRESRTYYFAMAVNIASAGTGAGDYFATISGGMNGAGTSLNARGRVYARAKDGKLAFGIAWGQNGYVDTEGIYEFNKSYIIVFKHMPGDKIGHLFIFDSLIPPTEPSTPNVSNSSSTEGFINGKELAFRQNTSSLNMLVGGIIASTSWPTGMTITKATLPINLIDFKATEENGFVKLNWSTASEKNNNYFEVLKSTDGINFNAIGSVNGSQNSSERKDYSLLDKSDIIGTTYYKLKQVDNNGDAQEFDPIVFNKANLDNDDLVVYVDANGKLNANFYAVAGELNISLYNLSGQKISEAKEVVKQSGKQNLLLNNSLSKGVYILKLSNGNKAVTKKVVL